MNELIINGTTYAIPSDRTKLSPRGLKLFGKLMEKNISPINTHKLMFFVLTSELNFFKRVRLWSWFLFQASTIERGDCLFLVQEFMEAPVTAIPPFKKISCSFVLLFPPTERMKNSTLWEFIQAESFFFQFLKTKNPEALDMLVAVLYRPKRKNFNIRKDEDIREDLTDAGINWIMARVKKIPHYQKILILQFFDASRMNIIETFKEVFPKKEASEEKNPFQSKKASSSAWIPLMSNLAGSMIHFKEIGQTNLYIALADIREKIKKNQSQAK